MIGTTPGVEAITAAKSTDAGAHRARPALAVCICTSDRPRSLEEALLSVVCQSPQPDEILIVDQSDGNETADLVCALQAEHESLRYIRASQKGLSRAYNLATHSTGAELIAFTDDDCVAPAGWLDSIIRCFDEELDAGLLYGQVLIAPTLLSRENVDGVTPALPIPRRRRLNRREGYRVFGMGANFAVRRALLEDLGGFDEVLGGGGPLQSAQDFDLSYRAFRRGHTILLAPEVVVHHYGFRSNSDWPRTVQSYGIGIGGFYGKHLRLGDFYAARLLGLALLRQSLRAVKRSVVHRGGGLEWLLLGYTIRGLIRSLSFSIDRRAMLYRLRRA